MIENSGYRAVTIATKVKVTKYDSHNIMWYHFKVRPVWLTGIKTNTQHLSSSITQNIISWSVLSMFGAEM